LRGEDTAEPGAPGQANGTGRAARAGGHGHPLLPAARHTRIPKERQPCKHAFTTRELPDLAAGQVGHRVGVRPVPSWPCGPWH